MDGSDSLEVTASCTYRGKMKVREVFKNSSSRHECRDIKVRARIVIIQNVCRDLLKLV